MIYPHDFLSPPESRPRILVGDADAPVEALEPNGRKLSRRWDASNPRQAVAMQLCYWLPYCGYGPGVGYETLAGFFCGKRLQFFECGECQGNGLQDMTQEYTRTFGLVN